MTKWNCEMSPDHVADLKKSGLSDETIEAAGIYTVPPYNIDKIVGNRPINSLLAFPYPGTDFIRYKFFPSLTDQDGHVQKYHQAKGTPPRLYVPPGFQCWQATWRVTEGEKKALAGTQRGLNVIGLGGIWNYAVKDGDGEPKLIDDLQGVPWQKKVVEIVPDGDFKKKPQVAHAVYRLTAMLEECGATVTIVELPGNEKLDDFLLRRGVEAFKRLPRMKKEGKMFLGAKAREDRRKAGDLEQLKFPEIYDGAAGEFARVYSSRIEVPKHFLYMAYLTALGSILSNRITVNSLLKWQPRLYVLLLGKSGDARKSTAIAVTTSFFRETLTEFAVSWGTGSAEGLQRDMKERHVLLLAFDEFALFVSKCGIKNSTLLQCVTTLFELNNYENRTKDQTIILDNAYLSLLAASTIDTFEKTWTSIFTSIGFNNRLFIVPGDSYRAFSMPQKLSFEETVRLKAMLRRVLSFVGEGREFEMTEKAQGAYDYWYHHRDGSEYARRLDTYAARFMSLMAANETKETIDAEIVDKIIALCDWQLRVRKYYSPIDADSEVAKMEEKIRRVITLRPAKEYELKKAVHAHRSGIWCYEQAKKNLQAAREIGYFDKLWTPLSQTS